LSKYSLFRSHAITPLVSAKATFSQSIILVQASATCVLVLDSRFSIILVLIFIFAQLWCYMVWSLAFKVRWCSTTFRVSSSRPRKEIVGGWGPCSLILWLPIFIRFIPFVSRFSRECSFILFVIVIVCARLVWTCTPIETCLQTYAIAFG